MKGKRKGHRRWRGSSSGQSPGDNSEKTKDPIGLIVGEWQREGDEGAEREEVQRTQDPQVSTGCLCLGENSLRGHPDAVGTHSLSGLGGITDVPHPT